MPLIDSVPPLSPGPARQSCEPVKQFISVTLCVISANENAAASKVGESANLSEAGEAYVNLAVAFEVLLTDNDAAGLTHESEGVSAGP
jgi:hypothetical protein